LEIVAIDSGSTDDTVSVLREFGATIVQIEPAAFNHGRTRNLGASYASGSLLIFANQMTLPAHDDWLENLVVPLVDDSQVAGVTSRILPRPDADVLARKDGLRDLSGSRNRAVRMIEDKAAYAFLSEHELRILVNFHTVSAGVRASCLREHPFPEVRTIGEDIAWAKSVLEAGWKLVHEPASRAYHSHNYGTLETLGRNVDDGIANREVVGRCLVAAQITPIIEALVRDDWEYLRNECGLSGAEFDRWRLESLLRRGAQMVGQWVGVNHDHLTGELARSLSGLEATRARAH
jgi:rhamnosyltransferase